QLSGTGALTTGDAQANSVSCGSAGSCSAGGGATDSRGFDQLMVVDEVNGAWHHAIEVPGSAALNKGDFAQISSVSCASAGNCSAGGWYMDTRSPFAPLVVSQVNGTLQPPIRVPGIEALNQHVFGSVESVSCASAGNCSAGGWYADSAFAVSEVNGTWDNAIEVPGVATLGNGSGGWISSMSCASARRCSAAGTYTDSFSHRQVFVVNKA